MKKILPILLIPALSAVPILGYAQVGKVQLTNESKLSINGKSNVNDFRCQSEHGLQQDPMNFSYHFRGDTINVDGVSLSLEISKFDCGKKAINRDFRSTLKYKEHPFIEIILNELVLEDEEDIIPTSAKVTIRIAGETEHTQVPLTTFESRENAILVGGKKMLRMTDFGLTPPSPMFGLIQVSDELEVEFDLVIRL
ncbi:YceI family protein [Rhodohalobacter sp.]|uniref:YceI family protein n=1 Tax=Rhodohalobacter sp. TaxID=1974210 RepID=UPI002ACE8D04|nr:YceI family protein [Rhodohalobacter sp.]MDZ7756212.1 YceI family protein [Rhodohalobacter sp.]